MRKIKALLSLFVLLVLLLVPTAQARPQPTLLFLVFGQSNAGSQGKGGDLNSQWQAIGDGVLLYSPQFTCTNQFVSVPHSSCKGKWHNRFGAELGMYKEVQDAYPGRVIAFARRSKGGTSINQWCSNTACNGEQFNNDVNLKDAAVNKLLARPDVDEVQIGGIVWLHNEADVTATLAPPYKARLQTMKGAWRDEVGNPHLAFMFYEVHTKLGTSAAETLQTGLEEIAASDPYTALIRNRDLPVWPGEPHFNSSGMTELGQRFGRAWVQIASLGAVGN